MYDIHTQVKSDLVFDVAQLMEHIAPGELESMNYLQVAIDRLQDNLATPLHTHTQTTT